MTFWYGNQQIEWTSSWTYETTSAGRRTRHFLFLLPALMAVFGVLMLFKATAEKVMILVGAAILIVFPLPYYAALTQPRYRAPIEPILVILGVYGLIALVCRN